MSEPSHSSFLDFENFSKKEGEDFFKIVDQLEVHFPHFSDVFEPLTSSVVALLFFEASTRTLLSFDMATKRLGAQSIQLSQNSSLTKGESLAETFENIAAMGPDLVVVRSNEDVVLERALEESPIPVINAGMGCWGHPTQALLDAYTIRSFFGDLSPKKLLFVGDVRFSRVARSNMELLSQFGFEFGVCSPPELIWEEGVENLHLQTFTHLEKALEWADICMGLRVQLERHGGGIKISPLDYAKNYCLNSQKLRHLKSSGLILHPGPYVENFDLEASVLRDSRCKIREQVHHGVTVRAALMAQILGANLKTNINL